MYANFSNLNLTIYHTTLLAFVVISRIYRNIMKTGEMKHEMT